MQNDFNTLENEKLTYTAVDIRTLVAENSKHDPSKEVPLMDHLNNELRMLIEFLKPSDDEVVLRRLMVKRIKKLILSGLRGMRRQKIDVRKDYYSHDVFVQEVGAVDMGESESSMEKKGNTRSELEDGGAPRRRQHSANVIKCIGSYATGLYLSGGDIDLTLFTEEEDVLEKLLHFLRRSPLILGRSVIFLSRARVPILRFMDVCRFRYDLSLNQESGVIHTKLVKEILHEQPAIKDMALFLKHFLKCRGLNENRRGGLNSYAQFLMIASFLNLHPLVQSQISIKSNLSVLFMDLFQFYGQDFCYEKAKICLSGYRMKTSSNYLSIEDPTDGSYDPGHLSTNMNAIREAFTHAYKIMDALAKERVGDKYVSISLWIKVSDYEIAWKDNMPKFYKKVIINREI